ncbi:MAG: LIC12162 family protein [Candidatus Omnitrophica bacterium]|nr:LIC12162 family protein [Candidatus Omnitrophota bacterium]MDD5352658.1 LIC12162 family protein [Candidatus Omnitrophota bacterium]MDD5550257.1 LIC12162 family protein [Candidatus Omnitrophota bacterium]
MSKTYLATSGISEIWDLDKKLLLLGPWCLTEQKNRALVKNREYLLVPSPWKPAYKIKEGADYCYSIYEKLLPELSERLNLAHQVSYPAEYWRVLVGDWLLHFIGILYDRYKRIENSIEMFSDFYTHALPEEQCEIPSFDTRDSHNKLKEDYYNLKLFSLIVHYLCPQRIIIKDRINFEYKICTDNVKYDWKVKSFYNLIKILDLFFKSDIFLTDMYHLKCMHILLLKWELGLKVVSFRNFYPLKMTILNKNYSSAFREKLKLEPSNNSDKFLFLLYKLIPRVIPLSYVENYNLYRDSVKNIGIGKIIGSAVGWYFNERFKFYAAEAAIKGSRLIEFQHGGGYGFSLSEPNEQLALDKNIFYTWGWSLKEDNNAKPLPSIYLSNLKDTHSFKINKILFAGTFVSPYGYRLNTSLQPDDMQNYFEYKKIFFRTLRKEVKQNVLYRPYISSLGWNEKEYIKEICPNIKFLLKGKLIDYMQKVNLVVIDNPQTSFLEALAINVPCVLYWDHETYLMRREAEEYFELLRKAHMLYRSPEDAARKVNEIYDNPMKWWLNSDIQNARNNFCERYAFASKDWLNIWAKEFRQLL